MPMRGDLDSVEGLYSRMTTERSPFLDRGRDSAALTIPSLLPRDLESGLLPVQRGHQHLPTPFQSVGARGTNNLSTQLLLSLFPPGRKFMELTLNEAEIRKQADGEALIVQGNETLLDMERQVDREFDNWGMRVDLFESLKHLVNEGNVLLHIPPDGKLQVWHLDSYTTRFDPRGHLTELIYVSNISPVFLPPEVLAVYQVNHPDWKNETAPAVIYTYIHFADDNRYHIHQEVEKTLVPNSEGDWAEADLPYMPLRLNRISGEHYGRGHTEEYFGDLKSLESLSKSLVEGAAASVKIVFMKNPAGATRMKAVAQAPNGAFVSGNASDFSTLKVDKIGDLRFALEMADRIETRLNFAYLLNNAVQRQAERVTAEEIRFLAQELEETLGGLYSILTQELQLPLAKQLLRRLKGKGQVPNIPEELAFPTVVTGLAALGKEEDLARLRRFIADGQAAMGPEAFSARIKADTMLRQLAVGHGVANNDLLISQQEFEQRAAQAAQQQAQLEASVASAPGVAKEVAAAAVQTRAPAPAPAP